MTPKQALVHTLAWIDKVPSDTSLPAMPGFDRDWIDSLIEDDLGNYPELTYEEALSMALEWVDAIPSEVLMTLTPFVRPTIDTGIQGKYIVLAGNSKGGVENCRYREAFLSLEEALTARELVSDHPWNRIVIQEGEFEYEIDPRRIKRLVKGVYQPCSPRGQVLTPE